MTRSRLLGFNASPRDWSPILIFLSFNVGLLFAASDRLLASLDLDLFDIIGNHFDARLVNGVALKISSDEASEV